MTYDGIYATLINIGCPPMLHLLILINNKHMTQFNFPTRLADHLEQEIYTKLIAEVQSNVDRLNAMWAKREQEGKTFHTKQTWHGEERICWYNETKGFLNIKFYQIPNPRYSSGNDYYRPLSCEINYAACKDNAHAQRIHTVALCTERVNGHLAVTDIVYDIDLKLGKKNLIEGNVTGHTANNDDFQIHLQMMWNYRYGENSANGYLTQYVQYRSDRRGARQEGKSIQQAIKDAEKQARRDEKLAIQNEKQMAKWEKFQKLPVVMEKWVDKEIKTLAAIISPEGLANIQKQADRMGYEFDRDWKIKSISKDIELHNTLRNDLRHWQNDETGLKALFDKGIDTRNKLKEMYGV